MIRARLIENRVLSASTFVLRLAGCTSLVDSLPGQFAMLRGLAWPSDPLLPRAFSLLGVDPEGVAEILIKVTGKASRLLQHARVGDDFSLLGPLGNSFPAPRPERTDWLIAGGVGLAPLLLQAVFAQRSGLAGRSTMFYGGRAAADLVLLDEIRRTGVELVCVTEDGSLGQKGRVTEAVVRALQLRPAGAPRPTLMACGPDPMLRAVSTLARHHGLPGHLSLEGEMACGIGVCLGCAVPCVSRAYRYTCVDGPVFDIAELADDAATAAAAAGAGAAAGAQAKGEA
jgi:dihydroorotate dehydrogenase electron transfer subunit